MTAEHIPALNSIGFHLGKTEHAASIWNERLEQLTEYKAEFGHCLVPQQYAVNPKLGGWVSTQRHNYKLQKEGKPSSMTEERIRALNGVGFDWEATNASWNALLEQLTDYKVQFGHCLVPRQYAVNPKLGEWVSTQRRNYRLYQRGKPSSMTEELIRALNGVGFNWEATNASWNALLEQLTEYKAEFGHCLVPQQYAVNPKLGGWVSTQRHNYKLQKEGKPSSMTEERIRALNGVDFDWDATNASWNALLEQLTEFKVQLGHCLVPNKYSANPELGRWVSNQRYLIKLYQEVKPSSMTEERIRELESIGFYWGDKRD